MLSVPTSAGASKSGAARKLSAAEWASMLNSAASSPPAMLKL
jgi:hypothetical protein